jgi:DNA replication and repair protein RecF
MRLTSLDLEEFRSYRSLHLDIEPAGLRLFGSNGSGKTSLLEAVAMLATTRSPRTSTEREVIAWKSGEEFGVAPYARCGAGVASSDGPFTISLAVEADPARGGLLRKEIRLDGRSVRSIDAVGRLRAVLFSVEDVALVSGAPQGRRRYLDLTISQLNGRYMRSLAGLNRVLAQRNSLLKSFARDRVHHADASVGAQLEFWDEELVRFGAYVCACRLATVSTMSEMLAGRFRKLANDRSVELQYRPSLDVSAAEKHSSSRSADDLAGVIAREYAAALVSMRRDEVRRGVTLVGPHRDDLDFAIDGVDLAAYGSRGEQRLAVVALKLAEVDLMTADAGEPPVLLLDDVLSELDSGHRDQLVTALADLDGQLLVTATDQGLLSHPVLAVLPVAQVNVGTVVPCE